MSVATFISIPFHHFVALKLIGLPPSANDTHYVFDDPGTAELCLQTVFPIRRNNQELTTKNERAEFSQLKSSLEIYCFTRIAGSCKRFQYSERKFTFQCNVVFSYVNVTNVKREKIFRGKVIMNKLDKCCQK